MIKKNIVFFSFATLFFIIHPLNYLCDDECLVPALLFSTLFSFLNLNIYKYFKGYDFDILSGYAYTVNSNTDSLIRFLWFFSLFIVDILVIFIAFKLSWI